MANGNNVTLTVFDRLFKDDAQVNAKNENVSAEMLKAFFDYDGPETVFDKVWIASFYKMESKTRGEMLRDLCGKLSPNEFDVWLNEADKDVKTIEDKKEKAKAAETVESAKKRIKAAENRVRRVIDALAGLRFSEIPVKKVAVIKGKLRVYVPFVEDNGEMDENSLVHEDLSMAELIKAGTKALVDEKLKTTSPRTPEAKGKEAELGAIVTNDKSALVKICSNLSRTLALAEKRDAYEGEAADALMNLAGEILRHFYSNDEGTALDQEMILDWLDQNVDGKVFSGEAGDTDEEKVA